MIRSLYRFLAIVGIAGVTLGTTAPANANSANDLVAEAKDVIDELMIDPDFQFMRKMIRDARAVVIVPELVKGGFIIGAEGGSAVIVARRDANTWSQPAFYTVASGSIGLQIGGQVAKLVLIVRNDKALEKILEDNVQFGADLSIAVGPIGAGAKGSTTTNLDADIVAFSKAKGLFGGGAFEGGVITSNADRNELFYGRPVSGRTILYTDQVGNAKANGLRQSLANAR